jgi:hypothetical protein
MRNCKLHRCFYLTAAVLLTLTACGGGGGGSAPTTSSVSLTNVTIPTLTDETYENGDPTSKTLQSFQVSTDLQGDVSSLSGKTIYVLVEDPDGFVERATLQQPLSQTRNTLLVETRVFGPPKGRYTSGFRIKVCYDSACNSQMTGSPLVIPYDITVLQGLVLNSNAPVTLSARAGEPKSITFPISLPSGLTYFPDTVPPPLAGQPQIELGQYPGISWTVATGTVPTATVAGTFSAGVYSQYVWVRANAQTPRGKTFGLTAQVQVNFSIAP